MSGGEMVQSDVHPDDSPAACLACGGRGLRGFYRVVGVPVHSTGQFESVEEALTCSKGDLSLAFCPNCAFIGNIAFDPAACSYSSKCEESQASSATFNAFAKSLAEHWVEQYSVRDKVIVEIGCGKGEFLALICEAGNNRGIGIDPSARPERIPPEARGRVQLIRELYGPQHGSLPADVILCRHTLEHIAAVGDFLRTIRRVLANRRDVIVLFELPDVTRVLNTGAFWDLYYEHCSYFSPGSLARLFRQSGFEIDELKRAYGDQYLLVAARPVDRLTLPHLQLEEDLEQVTESIERFGSNVQQALDYWRNEVFGRVERGQRVVLWGALSKAVAFLTTLGVHHDAIEYVVDINPRRHGKFMPGTGQRVVAPGFLQEYRPNLIIAMNPVYLAEIGRDLEQMGVRAELVAV